MTQSVKNLSAEQKLAIESLLGRRVSDDEQISVRAFSSPVGVSKDERAAAIDWLNRYFAEVDARRQQVSDEEEDAIIDEALRSVRPSFRPVR